MMARGGPGCATTGSKSQHGWITKQKSEVFDNQRLPIFFIVFLASFWRDKRVLEGSRDTIPKSPQ